MKKMLLALVITLVMASMAFAGGGDLVTTGTVTATGAAINVQLGYTPSIVLVSRVSVTAANNYQARYTKDMTAGYAILHGPSALTYITTGGISPYTGSTSAAVGFTIGTNASLNPSDPADMLFYEAYR